MKRWIPFIALLIVAAISVIYLLLFGHNSNYSPTSDNVATIYSEACADCHGIKGEGSGLLYPSLTDYSLNEEEVRDIIHRGTLFMPAFPNIKDSSLQKLSQFVVMKAFGDTAGIKSEN